LFWRLLYCPHCFNSTSDDPFIEEAEEEENACSGYIEMDKLCDDNQGGTATPPLSEKGSGSDCSDEGNYAQMDDDGIVFVEQEETEVGTKGVLT
jgi:hypothetical protein